MRYGYSTEDFEAAGLEVKHGPWRGKLAFFVRNPKSPNIYQRENWWCVDDSMLKRADEVGLLQAFDEQTLLGDLFSVKE